MREAGDTSRMAQTVCIIISAQDRTRLTAVVQDRNRPHKHVQRAKIVRIRCGGITFNFRSFRARLAAEARTEMSAHAK